MCIQCMYSLLFVWRRSMWWGGALKSKYYLTVYLTTVITSSAQSVWYAISCTVRPVMRWWRTGHLVPLQVRYVICMSNPLCSIVFAHNTAKFAGTIVVCNVLVGLCICKLELWIAARKAYVELLGNQNFNYNCYIKCTQNFQCNYTGFMVQCPP